MFFLNRFPVSFTLFAFLFLITPCLVVAVQLARSECIVFIGVSTHPPFKNALSVFLAKYSLKSANYPSPPF